MSTNLSSEIILTVVQHVTAHGICWIENKYNTIFISGVRSKEQSMKNGTGAKVFKGSEGGKVMSRLDYSVDVSTRTNGRHGKIHKPVIR